MRAGSSPTTRIPRGPSSSARDLAKPGEAGAQAVGDGQARDRLVHRAGQDEADDPALAQLRRRRAGQPYRAEEDRLERRLPLLVRVVGGEARAPGRRR